MKDQCAAFFRGAVEGAVCTVTENKLLDLFPDFSAQFLAPKFVDFVELHDHFGMPVNYDDNTFTNKIRKQLRKINIENQKHNVTLYGEELSTILHMVFNRDWEHGGRLYTSGFNSYQNIPKTERQHIRIDGQGTVELDFSSMHPRLAYAMFLGKQFDGDCYSYIHPSPVLRPLLKKAFNTLLNAESEEAARKAIQREINIKYQGAEFKAADIFDLIKTKHAPIAPIFCSGYGNKLMNIDSKIAFEVLKTFANKGEIALCIHDSFVVQSRFQDLLLHEMERNYMHFSGGFRCPVNG